MTRKCALPCDCVEQHLWFASYDRGMSSTDAGACLLRCLGVCQEVPVLCEHREGDQPEMWCTVVCNWFVFHLRLVAGVVTFGGRLDHSVHTLVWLQHAPVCALGVYMSGAPRYLQKHVARAAWCVHHGWESLEELCPCKFMSVFVQRVR